MNAFIIAALAAPQLIVASAYADINGFLAEYPLVKEFCYASSGDYLAVGLISEPMFTLSGITRYTKELENELAQKFGFREVAVTFDTDLVYAIKKLGGNADENAVKNIIDTARKRR